MKKYIPGFCAVIAAITFSAFAPKGPKYFTYAPSAVTNSLITDADSYTISAISCAGASGVPCKIDIEGFLDPTDYVTYLNSLDDDTTRLIDFFSKATAGEKL